MMKKKSLLTTAIATLTLIGAGSLMAAQERGDHHRDQGHAQDRAPQRDGPPAGDQPDLGAMLMEGLRETEGCLGVDAGEFMSGKKTIVAWFEDKAAVERWYYHPMHMRMMRSFGAGDDGHDHEPLQHVKDGVPIMVMASLTPSEESAVPGSPMPISQISIELYSPQPGGAHVNGRLAPPTFEVAHMKAYSTAE
ncbi:MAG: hypothetical protein ACYTGR_13750 [Planctomycetota bacterium]|jgi:hypothetical protein